MKKFIAISALLVLVSTAAGAQWYNFPIDKFKKKAEQKAEQKSEEKLRQEEAGKDTRNLELQAPVIPTEVPDPGEDVAEFFTDDAATPDSLEIYEADIPDVINVAMLLPVQLSGKTNSNFLEMYAGSLVALKDLGRNGLKVNLSVFDCVDEDDRITPDLLAASDVIIGPVSTPDILEVLSRCPVRKRLVSPLEPKAAALTDSCNVIQAPSSWTDQIDGLFDWLKADLVPGDDLVLVRDSAESVFGEQTRYLLEKLEDSGLKYKTTYLASSMTPSAIGTTRYLIASDRDSYIATAIRQIGIASATGKNGSRCLYLTSKMRNAKGVEQQYLYMSGAKVTMSYFTDYNDTAVKDFILSYRALFSDEPGSFAFQGYDTVRYFVGNCAEYGRQWYMKLPEAGHYKGLQSDFEFKDTEKAGQNNTAVKRVVFLPDMSTSVQ